MAMDKMLQLGLLAGGGWLVYSYLMQEEEGTETFLDATAKVKCYQAIITCPHISQS